MGEKIGVNEALSIAKQYLNHYRAFEKLKEIIELVGQSEQLISENLVKRDAIVKEMSDLSTQKDYWITEIEKLKDEKVRVEVRIEELKAEFKADSTSFNQEIENIKAGLLAIEKQYSRKATVLKEEHGKIMADYAEEEVKAREKLEAVKLETKSLLEKFQ